MNLRKDAGQWLWDKWSNEKNQFSGNGIDEVKKTMHVKVVVGYNEVKKNVG